MTHEGSLEDFPTEIAEYMTGFLTSVNSVQNVIQTLMSLPKPEHLKVGCI